MVPEGSELEMDSWFYLVFFFLDSAVAPSESSVSSGEFMKIIPLSQNFNNFEESSFEDIASDLANFNNTRDDSSAKNAAIGSIFTEGSV